MTWMREFALAAWTVTVAMALYLLLDASGYAAQIRESATCHPEGLAAWEHAAAVLLALLLAGSRWRRFALAKTTRAANN